MPVAVNCTPVPSGRDALAGVTAIEARTGAVTVRVVLPPTPEYVAVMVVEPCALLVAMPVLETVAALVFEEVHVAELVRSLLLLSLNLPVAVNCCVRPAAIEVAAGVIWIDRKAAAGLTGVELLPPPQPASSPKHTSAIEICNFFIR